MLMFRFCQFHPPVYQVFWVTVFRGGHCACWRTCAGGRTVTTAHRSPAEGPYFQAVSSPGMSAQKKLSFPLGAPVVFQKKAYDPAERHLVAERLKRGCAVRGAFAMKLRETHPGNHPAGAVATQRIQAGLAFPIAGGGEPSGEPTPWKLGPNEAKWGNPAPICSRAKNRENLTPGLCLPRSGNIRPSGAKPPKILSQKPSGYEPDAVGFFLRHRNPLRFRGRDAWLGMEKRIRGTPRGTRDAIRGTRR